MSGGCVVCGRHSRGDGEVRPLVIHINTSISFHFPFFAPNSVVPPPVFVCCLTVVAHRDKVSLDHPLPSVLINSCLSVLLSIIFTPQSHHESPRHLLVSCLFKTHPPQAIPCPSGSTTFPDTRPASILTHCHRSVHSPSQLSPPTNLPLFFRGHKSHTVIPPTTSAAHHRHHSPKRWRRARPWHGSYQT
jgi:hypothetical protein